MDIVYVSDIVYIIRLGRFEWTSEQEKKGPGAGVVRERLDASGHALRESREKNLSSGEEKVKGSGVETTAESCTLTTAWERLEQMIIYSKFTPHEINSEFTKRLCTMPCSMQLEAIGELATTPSKRSEKKN